MKTAMQQAIKTAIVIVDFMSNTGHYVPKRVRACLVEALQELELFNE
jgi:hypothetical protein